MKEDITTAAGQPNRHPWAALTEIGRDQLAATAGWASAILNGVEAMHKVQERVIHEAADHHAVAAERLKNGCSASDMATIHANLLRYDIEITTNYLQQMAATSMEMQTRMLAAWSRTINTQTVLESLSTFAGKPHWHVASVSAVGPLPPPDRPSAS